MMEQGLADVARCWIDTAAVSTALVPSFGLRLCMHGGQVDLTCITATGLQLAAALPPAAAVLKGMEEKVKAGHDKPLVVLPKQNWVQNACWSYVVQVRPRVRSRPWRPRRS